ncbi:MAG: hypothetical protein Q9218_000115 [Villophora microphyllina]
MRGLHWSLSSTSDSHKTGKHTRAGQHQNAPSVGKSLLRLLLILVAIDGLKAIIAVDPRFWGRTEAESQVDPPSLALFPPPEQIYRSITAFLVIYLAVQLVTTCGILLFVHTLGPSVVGTWGLSWTHAPAFGDLSTIATRGLRGFWGIWWHQFFRLTLEPPSSAAARLFVSDDKGSAAKALRMVTAFFLSGAIHACGSYTMWGASQPRKTFYFFALQSAGIIVQTAVARAYEAYPMVARPSPPICRLVNVFFTVHWLLITSPLLVGDYARGGLWLAEPMPFSPLALVGFPRRSSTGLLWADLGISWYWGDRWWQSGLAL